MTFPTNELAETHSDQSPRPRERQEVDDPHQHLPFHQPSLIKTFFFRHLDWECHLHPGERQPRIEVCCSSAEGLRGQGSTLEARRAVSVSLLLGGQSSPELMLHPFQSHSWGLRGRGPVSRDPNLESSTSRPFWVLLTGTSLPCI
jgi:hypothetical protein